MGAITYMVGKQEARPALLFEKIKGYQDSGVSVLFNRFGSSKRRIAVTLDEDPAMPMIDLIRATMTKLDRAVRRGKCRRPGAGLRAQADRRRDRPDQLPFPKHWPLDGGRDTRARRLRDHPRSRTLAT